MNLGEQNITTIKNIKEILHDIQKRHPQINTFGWGKDADIGASEVIYPLLWTSPTSATLIRSEQNGRYTSLEVVINLKVLDSIKSGNENEVDIESSTFQAVTDIINEFTEHPFYKYKNMSTVGNIFYSSLKEYSDDNSYGWETDITIRIRNNTSWCGIPATPLAGYENVTPQGFTATTTSTLTCDTLGDCPIIISIQDDITNLETIVYRTNELISGGASFLSGLTYDVTPLEYVINGQFYTTAAATQVTANSGDTNFDRIDLIIADVNGTVSILEGTPSANPVQPDVDETTQVVVAILTVPAGATAIPVQETLVYNEDVGVPTEWNGTVTNASIDLAYTGITYSGTKSLRFNVTPNTAYAQFDSTTTFDTSVQNTIQFWIYNTAAWTSAHRLNIRLRNIANATVGSVVQLYNGRYGFTATASSVGVWQLVSIPIADFNLTSPIISKLDFQAAVTSGIGFSAIIDVVKFVEGAATNSQANKWWFVRGNTSTTIIPTTTNSTLRLAGGANINTYASGTNYINFDLNTTLTGLTTVNANIFSGGTFYGDGSNLTGISSLWTDGGNTSLYPTGFGTTTSTGFGSITAAYNSSSTGFYGSIWGGLGHTNSAYYAAIVGGLSNSITSTASNNYGFIGGGRVNVISGTARHGVILGGESNSITAGNHSAIVGGVSSTISNQGSFIGGGSNHTISWNYSGIVGGRYNTIHALYSFQGGSYSSDVTGWYAGIVGGIDNNVTGYYSGIFGGSANTITHTHSTILGGSGLSSVADNTAHVPYLNINQTDFTTTATTYNQLVIDNSGNVMKNNQFYIGVNFTVTGVNWDYVALNSFSIYSIDNPSAIGYNLLHNGTAYTLNNVIALYDSLSITGVTATGVLKLNATI
jgi:hypothetical protein